jgi:hypothetical protein
MLSELHANAIRFPVEPRDVPIAKAARRLHLTVSDFERALPRLLDRGFPRADPDTGHYDLKAIDEWMDRRSGLVKTVAAPDAEIGFRERLGELRGKGSRR